MPKKTRLAFELRWAETEPGLDEAKWCGPGGEGTHYDSPGTSLSGVPDNAEFLQYRATFVSENGCLSPKLREVTVGLERAHPSIAGLP